MADISKIQIDGTTNDIVSKGMPSGGTAGQVLKKASGTSYDTEWADSSEITIDESLNDSSDNPVANYVLADAFTDIDERLIALAENKVDAPPIPVNDKNLYCIGCVENNVTHDWVWGAKLFPVSSDESENSDTIAAATSLTYQLFDMVGGKADKPTGQVGTHPGYFKRTKTGSGPFDYSNTWQTTDKALTTEDGLADAKAVGDALALKANAVDVHSVPSGGGAGQVLRKASATDYDLEWATPSGGGGGSEEVYWATYNVTTTDSIIAANAAGKTVAISYDDVGETYILTLQYIGDDDTCEFTCLSDATSIAYIEVTAPGGSGNWGQLGYVDIPQDYYDIGAAPAVSQVTVSTAGAVTQALDPNKIYHFTGALTSLTITLNAASAGQLAQYHFDFDSGSTAPTVTLPGTVTMHGGTFSPEASKHYEIDILNNYGVSVAW